MSAVPESLPCRQAEYDQVYTFVELRLQERSGGLVLCILFLTNNTHTNNNTKHCTHASVHTPAYT